MPKRAPQHVSLKSAEFELLLEIFWMMRATERRFIAHEFTYYELADLLNVSHQSMQCLCEAAYKRAREAAPRRGWGTTR